jgi:hypothetical protein
LVNEALSTYGQEHIETVARRILDLRDSGFVLLDDIGAEIQVSDADSWASRRIFASRPPALIASHTAPR